MEDLITILQNYGPYIGLPVIIAYIVQWLKLNVLFFSTVLGIRLVHFLPLVLGLIGGLLLPEETWQSKILVGGFLGSISIFIYKFITVSIAPKQVIEDKIAIKESLKAKPVETSEEDPSVDVDVEE